ncbi:protein PHOSPHATE STARVATION RESPONSE 1-like [Dioscorea cayenensis subsp. rotundata]|uniref:Protein PHOSPHATE STARVATION RESPONSE 1-like n=1 Tax=Dioscorea cayennensis subsp. rotundata TaxID=55577 RepID=A0AB40BLP9_DIOCR|nr:protein PHOSPHATE STARVATION RESPONSE 1-like [Dioscorea cayenensis subsp. rotundata]
MNAVEKHTRNLVVSKEDFSNCYASYAQMQYHQSLFSNSLPNSNFIQSRFPISSQVINHTDYGIEQQDVKRGDVRIAKQRIRWTHELHEQFVEAVNCLGGPMKATPKGILKLMESQGLTIFHIKSHLQKYRAVKCIMNFSEGKHGGKANNDRMPIHNSKKNGGVHILEALRLQLDVQKNLHEQLEFQKKLQSRIEEHANYLQRMFDFQKRSCSYFENTNAKNQMDSHATESSSYGGYSEFGEIYLNESEAKWFAS